MHAVSVYAERRAGNTDLASELGETHGFPKAGPLIDVGLQVIDIDVVPVDGHLLDTTVVTTAHAEELGHPVEAVGVRGGNRASESVTLAGKRFDVLVPNTEGRGRIDISLTRFVDPRDCGLIHASERTLPLLRTR